MKIIQTSKKRNQVKVLSSAGGDGCGIGTASKPYVIRLESSVINELRTNKYTYAVELTKLDVERLINIYKKL